MLLAIDIGNTHVVAGLFQEAELGERWELKTDQASTPDDWWISFKRQTDSAGLAEEAVDAVIIASVVPPVGRALSQMSERYIGQTPLRVDAALPLDLGLDVKEPESVGADRICNVVAARELYGAPCVIVDLGTATTFDVVDESGHFIGGAIAPGIETSARQLFSSAALITGVELEVPGAVIGRDTRSNLLAGIIFGGLDQIDGLLARIRVEKGWTEVTTIITGGLGGLLASELKTPVIHDPDLTLRGLQLIYKQCK